MESEAFLVEYDRRLRDLHRFAALCERQLHQALDDTGVVRAITTRVKARASVADKLRRPDKRFGRLTDMTDLVGARVITMLAEDVPAVIEVLERSFVVDGENCWDMSWMLGTEDFGYRSVHYMVAPRSGGIEEEWARGLRCEVQVRSLLQDAWAQIAHGFSYKSLLSVPQAAHRRMSLAAGLLEVADREFGELRREVASYRLEIESSRSAAIARVLTSNEDVFGVDRTIAADVESALLAAPVTYLAAYETMLTSAGFHDVDEAVAHLSAEADAVRAFAHAVARRGKRPRLLFRGVSLFYLCYYVAATDEERLDRYMTEVGIGTATSRKTNVPEIVGIAARIRG